MTPCVYCSDTDEQANFFEKITIALHWHGKHNRHKQAAGWQAPFCLCRFMGSRSNVLSGFYPEIHFCPDVRKKILRSINDEGYNEQKG